MRLAIADPPYPPIYSERRDLADGSLRTTWRSRAVRWYGDMHPEAAIWDNPSEHRDLMLRLIDEFDGWAIATTPDGLGAYYPLPISAHVPRSGFPGAKPAAWTRWVLAALGYDPETDELVDLFPGSGAVSAAADGMLSLS